MNNFSSRKAEPVIAGQTVIEQSPAFVEIENLNVEDPTIQLASNDDPTHVSGMSQDQIDLEKSRDKDNTKKSVATPAEQERKISSNDWTGDLTQSANVIPNVQMNEEQILVT